MTVIPSLPQELIEHIIDLSEPPNAKHLGVLSTVSTAWRARSQYHIFKSFTLHDLNVEEIHSTLRARLQHDLFKTPNPNFENEVKIYSKDSGLTGTAVPRISTPLSYVRCLHLRVGTIYPEQDGAHLEILRLFTSVTELQIYRWDFRPFKGSDIETFFEHFGGTVTTLGINCCLCNSAVLIFLKSLFPQVNNLRIQALPPIDRPEILENEYSDMPLSREVSFQGKLTFKHLDGRYSTFLALVSENRFGVQTWKNLPY